MFVYAYAYVYMVYMVYLVMFFFCMYAYTYNLIYLFTKKLFDCGISFMNVCAYIYICIYCCIFGVYTLTPFFFKKVDKVINSPVTRSHTKQDNSHDKKRNYIDVDVDDEATERDDFFLEHSSEHTSEHSMKQTNKKKFHSKKTFHAPRRRPAPPLPSVHPQHVVLPRPAHGASPRCASN